MSDNVVGLNVDKKFQPEGEMAQRIYELVMEYSGQVSAAAAIGVLEMVKSQIIKDT